MGVCSIKQRRLEVLLGTKPDAALDESQKTEAEGEAERLAQRERMASAGGQLIGAAFAFIGEIFSQRAQDQQNIQMTEMLRSRLSECLEKDKDGRLKMTIALPDESVLDGMAKTLAQILGSGGKQ
jgi:hypothetical protein